ncbi:hypothetical protein MLOOGBEN_21540 [Bacillus sp. EB106-08-02-XG196]|uniref:hypothetical protein n=1 Tax=Bacillus sp. EB106-08-02-XG196 TaxID=2737049 RepID=UPI0015C4DE4C|nr:hypothetical protein [Bacillus sp. EB106-08-02-XG196]NWQ43287.1 hypothetical protein [Bacillus sp. EB106-08-02-XG196]
MIVDCHFHVDETMLTLDKMLEGMDENNVTKTALIAPMNETMFEGKPAGTVPMGCQPRSKKAIRTVPPVYPGHLYLFFTRLIFNRFMKLSNYFAITIKPFTASLRFL